VYQPLHRYSSLQSPHLFGIGVRPSSVGAKPFILRNQLKGNSQREKFDTDGEQLGGIEN